MSVFRVARVQAPDDRLRGLTFPRYADLLSADALSRDDAAAFAAWGADGPVGLALLLRDHLDGSGCLTSVMVASAWRRRGIGRALLAKIEDCARQWGAPALYALHSDVLRGRDSLRGLLAQDGWNAPELGLLSLTGRAGWAAEARAEWASLFTRLAVSGFSVTPWHCASGDDLDELDRLGRETERMSYQYVVDPLPQVSVVVREHGRPVGWVLGNHGTRAGDIYYPVGWVLPRLQRRGWLVGALVEACLAQERAFGNTGTCSFQTAGSNRAMQDFMLRRLSKWTITLTRHWRQTKALSG